mgnify:CR=1 FL=1
MVTREDVENIALLSKLFVPEEELDGLTKSMQEIIDFAGHQSITLPTRRRGV